MAKKNKGFFVSYEFSSLPDAEERVAMAFDLLFDEIETILREERLKGKEQYGKKLAAN